MERIASFEVDHTILQKGMYISRTDGGITTYDIRMRRPNAEPVIDNDAIHTIEHLFATYVRNSEQKGNIIYFGPMGCRTGFYFLTRYLVHDTAISLTQDAMCFIAGYDGEIPGVSAKECGNSLDHSLEKAKHEAALFLPVINTWTANNLSY